MADVVSPGTGMTRPLSHGLLFAIGNGQHIRQPFLVESRETASMEAGRSTSMPFRC
jgi:hypothetical protein